VVTTVVDGSIHLIPEIHLEHTEAEAATKLSSELGIFIKKVFPCCLKIFIAVSSILTTSHSTIAKAEWGNQVLGLAGALILGASTGRRVVVERQSSEPGAVARWLWDHFFEPPFKQWTISNGKVDGINGSRRRQLRPRVKAPGLPTLIHNLLSDQNEEAVVEATIHHQDLITIFRTDKDAYDLIIAGLEKPWLNRRTHSTSYDNVFVGLTKFTFR
jgi:hypothetical protein